MGEHPTSRIHKRSCRERRAIVFAAATILIASEASATLVVAEPWVRISPDQRSAEGYMQLRSSEGATVVGLSSDVSSNITMRERGATRAPVAEITLPPGETVMFAPGAQRFVIPRLIRRLKLGDRVALVLTVASADGSRQQIPVNAEVRARSPTDDHLRGHRH
jgi:copper(I)-binding protein